MKRIGSSMAMFVATVLIAGGLYSCNEKVSSKPNYIFKPAPQKGAVAKVMGKEVSEDQLFKGIEGDLYEAEYRVFDIKMNKLRAYLLEVFMEAHSDKKNMSNDEFLEKHISKGKSPSEADIEKFIKEKNIPKEHINAQLKDRVKNFLDQEMKRKLVDEWLNEQIAKNPVEVYIPKPERPVFDVTVGDSPFFGNADAKVTIVEFSDFQCPYCARGASIVTDLKKKYGNKVKVVFKNFPLPFHQHARLAAEAGLCANAQGKDNFWKLHDEMFADQERLIQSDLVEKAAKIGLKKDQFEKCLNDHTYAAQVDADIKEGEKLGIKSTPTFYVNGKLIAGAQPLEVFSELIDEELNK